MLAWASLFAYVAAYFCMLYARRRARREFLTFGLLVGCVSIISLADVVLLQAQTPARALLGARLNVISFVIALPFFVGFCFATAGTSTKLMKLVDGWALAGLACAVSGFATTSSTSVEPLWNAPGATPFLAHMRPWMMVYLGFSWFIAALAFRSMAATLKSDVNRPTLLLAILVNMLAAVHDILLHGGWIVSYPMLPHSATLTVFAMSYVLLGRIAWTTEALHRRTFELSASYDELRSTHERLLRREQLAALGELSAVIAHEVRNPLAIIKNAVSGLRRADLRREDRRTLLDILDEEVVRLNRMMRDLLAYSRPIAPQHQPLDLVPMLETIISSFGDDGDPPGSLRGELIILDAPRRIEADPHLLERAPRRRCPRGERSASASSVVVSDRMMPS